MPSLPLPRRRRYRILLAIGVLGVLYLVALSVIPALFGGESATDRITKGKRAVQAPNWGLVVPEDRANLGRAVDDAWRALRSYRERYVVARAEELAAGRFELESTSSFRLDGKGRITAQRDTNFTAASFPGSEGKEQRFEGFRVLTSQPYVNSRGHRVADAELIYGRNPPGDWTCQRQPADKAPPPAPGLDFTDAGDAGFSEIDGRRVRGFILARGAFGLRSAATVWLDTETLQVRRQEADSVLGGRREMWSYTAFDETVEIQPPTGIPCQDS